MNTIFNNIKKMKKNDYLTKGQTPLGKVARTKKEIT
jgi:hypothetical protein